MAKGDGCGVENVAALVEDECYLVRDSGELPEIAYHTALYYLCIDPGGPRVELSKTQRFRLLEAAMFRFAEIILRDLDFSARNLPAVRGVGRAIVNYRRFSLFCQRQELDSTQVQLQIQVAFDAFIACALAQGGISLNCSFPALQQFADELGSYLPDEVQHSLSCIEPAEASGI